MARTPQYGVKKTADELSAQDPSAVLYGVTPDNKFIPVKIDDDGRLELASVTLEPGDIEIGAVEIKNHNTDDRVAVNTNHELRVESRLHDNDGTGITSTTVGIKQGIDVNVVGGAAFSVSEAEDDDIPANKPSVGLIIPLNYAYDGISWKRVHQTSGAMHSQLVSAGTQISATGTALNVHIVGGSPTGPTDTDDGTVAGGQNANLDIGLNYGWNGSNWERLNSSSGKLLVDGSGVTQPISVASLPLPIGAATESTLSTFNGKFIDGNDIGDVTINNGGGLLAVNIQDGGNSITIDGTVTANQGGNWPVRLQDGSGNNLTSQLSGTQQALDVGINVAGVQVDPRQIRALTIADVVTVQQFIASNLNAQVVGNVSSGGVDSGNPVKVGGKYSKNPSILTDGQRGDIQLGPYGSTRVLNTYDGFGSVSWSDLGVAKSASVTHDTVIPNGVVWHLHDVVMGGDFAYNTNKRSPYVVVIWDPTGTNVTIAQPYSMFSKSFPLKYKIVGNGAKILRVIVTNGDNQTCDFFTRIIYSVG